MAIYHFSVKTISRSAGRSAVACSAYRSGEKLEDHYQGKTQDYTQKTGVESKKIYAPENTKKELLERQKLWNAVETVERRKDATLAREFEIAFPHEFNAEQRQVLLDELCQKIVEKHGVIVDACIHAPHTKSGSDERNFHAHIMFTSRQIDPQTGDFAKKKNRDFNKEQSSETVSHWREYFADLTNHHLEKYGFTDRVDHRSYQDQGVDFEATQHEGVQVTQLRRQGIDTEISLSNDLIKQNNQQKREQEQILKGLDQEILLSEKTLGSLKEQDQIQKAERQKTQEKQKEKEQDIKQTSQNYFREVFSAIFEAKKLRDEVDQYDQDYENDFAVSMKTDSISLKHKTYQAHQNIVDLADRYEKHAKAHNFLSLRDRTIQYLDSKRQDKKDLGFMSRFTKQKERKNLNDSIVHITDLFNYFSDIAIDFQQNDFIKSIKGEYLHKEQEIKEKKESQEYSRKYLEERERQNELLAQERRNRIDEQNRRTRELHLAEVSLVRNEKEAEKPSIKPDEPKTQPTDWSNDFDNSP